MMPHLPVEERARVSLSGAVTSIEESGFISCRPL